MTSTSELQTAIQKAKRIQIVGAETKPALSHADASALSTGLSTIAQKPVDKLWITDLSGVLEYDPQEYTFTALAGTPLKEIRDLLANEGQYLPFDPPQVEAGATLGGTVAAGLSGAERLRYGGVRDFLLGVCFISGEGQLLTGGGKVVKNAAGFDLPKLMVGSLGQCGVLVDLTFKVFPKPEQYLTLKISLPTSADAQGMMTKLALSKLDLACLDFAPPNTLFVRLAGREASLQQRLERVQTFIGTEGKSLWDEADAQVWQESREFSWLPNNHNHSLVKIVLSPLKLAGLEASLLELEPQPPRRYSVAGNVLWLAWPESLDKNTLKRILSKHHLGALALTGTWETPLLGEQKGQVFLQRLRSVLDPEHKFVASMAGINL